MEIRSFTDQSHEEKGSYMGAPYRYAPVAITNPQVLRMLPLRDLAELVIFGEVEIYYWDDATNPF